MSSVTWDGLGYSRHKALCHRIYQGLCFSEVTAGGQSQYPMAFQMALDAYVLVLKLSHLPFLFQCDHRHLSLEPPSKIMHG